MAIFTTFLKLLKPEKNDYVDVEKHISENYDKIDNKVQELSNSNDENTNSISELLELINGNNLSFKGIINDEATFNEATKTGWYKVSDFKINNMYGYGFLYVIVHDQTTLQIFFSHKAGIAYRQDWSRNIAPIPWIKIGEGGGNVDINKILGIEFAGDLNNNNQKIQGKSYYDTANKKIFKCLENTSINNADSRYFTPISNNDIYEVQQNCLVSDIVYWRYSYVKQSGRLPIDRNKIYNFIGKTYALFLRVTISHGANGNDITPFRASNHSFICDFVDRDGDFLLEYDETKCSFELSETYALNNLKFEGKYANSSWISCIELISRLKNHGNKSTNIGG